MKSEPVAASGEPVSGFAGIITVMGLPGSGKSTLIKHLKSKHPQYGARYEPSEDIDYLLKSLGPEKTQEIMLERFAYTDCGQTGFWLRDSDYFTCLWTFGSSLDLMPLFPQGAMAPISDALIFLKISPKEQKQRILKRNRPFAEQELMFCSTFWHNKIEAVFQKHPAKTKRIIEVGNPSL